MAGEWFPPDPYLERRDEPVARPNRPIGMGDVFLGHPHVRAPREVKPGQWKFRAANKPDALTMMVAHPCSARANTSGRLKDDMGLAPIIPIPVNFESPWTTHYELFPLPALYEGRDYAADLSKAFPCAAESLAGKRITCLSEDALAGLLDRIVRNDARLEAGEVPGHYTAEAQRLRMEMDLWEIWVVGTGGEDGFQEWMKGEWMEGSTREQSMRGHFEEMGAALAEELGVDLEGAEEE
jgi:hypothetical protein